MDLLPGRHLALSPYFFMIHASDYTNQLFISDPLGLVWGKGGRGCWVWAEVPILGLGALGLSREEVQGQEEEGDASPEFLSRLGFVVKISVFSFLNIF